jgi:hypothetical protein
MRLAAPTLSIKAFNPAVGHPTNTTETPNIFLKTQKTQKKHAMRLCSLMHHSLVACSLVLGLLLGLGLTTPEQQQHSSSSTAAAAQQQQQDYGGVK